jgi:hypothetical protein
MHANDMSSFKIDKSLILLFLVFGNGISFRLNLEVCMNHIIAIPCHHSMACPQVGDAGVE